MQITITSSIAQIAAEMGHDAQQIERAIEVGVRAATEKVALPKAQERLEVIYQQPIPLTSSGKPAWVRSGSLKDAEEAAFPRAEAGVIQTNPSSTAKEYSEHRHELQTRLNPWREEAAQELENSAQLVQVFETAFSQHLGW